MQMTWMDDWMVGWLDGWMNVQMVKWIQMGMKVGKVAKVAAGRRGSGAKGGVGV